MIDLPLTSFYADTIIKQYAPGCWKEYSTRYDAYKLELSEYSGLRESVYKVIEKSELDHGTS